jgi:hypothetical protein
LSRSFENDGEADGFIYLSSRNGLSRCPVPSL